MENVMLMAVGNAFTGDDGVGPFVLAALDAAYDFPANVTLFDVDAQGSDLMAFLGGCDALLLVDALDIPGAAGTVSTLRNDPRMARVTHAPELRAVLCHLEETSASTDARLVGVIPQAVDTGLGVTDAVLAAVPEMMDAVVMELTRWGAAPRKKVLRGGMRWWWQQGAGPGERRLG